MSRHRPRVLILTVGFGVGGAEQLILMTAPRLIESGFDVTVAALKGPGPIASELEAAGVRCLALNAHGRADLLVLGRLLRLLRAQAPDILHAHLFPANLAARLVGRAAGVPVVITAHHDTEVWSRPHHRLLERLTARLSDRIVACSEAVRNHVLDCYRLPGERVITLRNAIAIPPLADDPAVRLSRRADLGAGPGELLIGTLGRLEEPKKGLSGFLRAASIAAGRDSRTRFALIGDGPARGLLERLAASVSLSGRVVFAGERRDVAELLTALDLFVQPSQWEGFGLTLLEAMAAARPVVASRVGGIPEIVRDGVDGLLVPPGDAGRLAEAILDLLHDPVRAARMGRAGRERVATSFGIDHLVRDTVDLYRALLGKPGGAPTALSSAPPGRAA